MQVHGEAGIARSVVAYGDFREVSDRLLAEGVERGAVAGALSALVIELISEERGTAAASAYLYGMARHAARFAADEIKRKG